jgi:hypothetical protein
MNVSTSPVLLLSLVFISSCFGSEATVTLKRAHADVTIPQVANWAFAPRPAVQGEQTISLIPTYHVTESMNSYVPTASITLQLAPVPLSDQSRRSSPKAVGFVTVGSCKVILYHDQNWQVDVFSARVPLKDDDLVARLTVARGAPPNDKFLSQFQRDFRLLLKNIQIRTK